MNPDETGDGSDDSTTDVENYASALSPTGTERSPGNTILTLDAHRGEPKTDHPQYTQPELSETQLSVLADALSDRGALEESARLEIERRRVVDNKSYAPMFTAYALTRIVVQLVGVKLDAQLTHDTTVRDALTEFADLIDESDVAPLDERYESIGADRVVAHQGEYVDPFRAISGIQTVFFVDDTGEIIKPPDSATPYTGETPTIPAWVP